MAKDFDPYREALVIETATIWPEQYDAWESGDRLTAESRLHAAPQQAAHLEYIRQHTGFCRQITVTEPDLKRLGMV